MITGGARPLHVFLLPVLLFVLQGCAGPMLQNRPASVQETRSAVSAFGRFLSRDKSGCPGRFDAEVAATVFVKGWFSDHEGKLSGYLQAMEPGYIKFAAVNPFGQPLLIFMTDGREFKLLNVLESAAYTGPVDSEKFRKFAPAGFAPEQSYYWLTGRLPAGSFEIVKVLRDRGEKGFWLLLKDGHDSLDRLVLFDPDRLIIARHVLMNNRGEQIMEVVYRNYLSENPVGGDRSSEGACLIPSSITVASNSGFEKKIDLTLSGFLQQPDFSPTDFDMEIPANMERHVIR